MAVRIEKEGRCVVLLQMVILYSLPKGYVIVVREDVVQELVMSVFNGKVLSMERY